MKIIRAMVQNTQTEMLGFVFDCDYILLSSNSPLCKTLIELTGRFEVAGIALAVCLVLLIFSTCHIRRVMSYPQMFDTNVHWL